MHPSVNALLTRLYRPSVHRLYRLLGRDLGWEGFEGCRDLSKGAAEVRLPFTTTAVKGDKAGPGRVLGLVASSSGIGNGGEVVVDGGGVAAAGGGSATSAAMVRLSSSCTAISKIVGEDGSRWGNSGREGQAEAGDNDGGHMIGDGVGASPFLLPPLKIHTLSSGGNDQCPSSNNGSPPSARGGGGVNNAHHGDHTTYGDLFTLNGDCSHQQGASLCPLPPTAGATTTVAAGSGHYGAPGVILPQ